MRFTITRAVSGFSGEASQFAQVPSAGPLSALESHSSLGTREARQAPPDRVGFFGSPIAARSSAAPVPGVHIGVR